MVCMHIYQFFYMIPTMLSHPDICNTMYISSVICVCANLERCTSQMMWKDKGKWSVLGLPFLHKGWQRGLELITDRPEADRHIVRPYLYLPPALAAGYNIPAQGLIDHCAGILIKINLR